MNKTFQAGLERILECKFIGFAFANLDGVITSADETFLRIVGHGSELQLNLHEITPSEHHHRDKEAYEKLQAFGSFAPFDKEFLRKDGSRAPVLFGGAIMQETIICFVVDLTQHQQAQTNLTHLAYMMH